MSRNGTPLAGPLAAARVPTKVRRPVKRVSVACPTCGAERLDPCVSGSGNPMHNSTHVARVRMATRAYNAARVDTAAMAEAHSSQKGGHAR